MSLLTAAAFTLGAALTAAAQAPPPPPPASAGDAQVRTKQVQVKQRKFDYYIKDGTNQLNFAKNRYLSGRKDLCENNLILSQLRVDVTLSLMRDHPNELANLSGFFVLKSTREGYFKSYTEYQRQVLALQDEIRLFAERNGPFAAFNYYKANLQQGVLGGGEGAAANIEAKINQAINQNTTVKPAELGGPGGVAGVGAGGGVAPGPMSAVARNFFSNPTDPSAQAAFIQQAIAGGLSPAVANQLAAAFAANDIRTVAQIAAQNPNSAEAQQALAALLQRLGVSAGLQQLGMSSEDAQSAQAAFQSGNIAALEALKEKYRDNPAVVAALNALINQLRSGGQPVAVAALPVNPNPVPVPITTPPPVNPVPTTTTPTTTPPPSFGPGTAPPLGTKVYDANGNLMDIWSGGADPSEGTRATYADEKGGRVSSEMRMTRQFIPRPGGGYTMQEAPDPTSRTEWALDIAPKGDPEPAGDGLKVTFEVANLLNPASRFEVLAWVDAKGQRIPSTGKTFTTVVPKGKFTIMVEGKTQTFKNASPFRIKVEGGQ